MQTSFALSDRKGNWESNKILFFFCIACLRSEFNYGQKKNSVFPHPSELTVIVFRIATEFSVELQPCDTPVGMDKKHGSFRGK